MIKKLRDILNSYTDEELKDVDLYVNLNEEIQVILVNEFCVDLITETAEIIVNDKISKERCD